MKRSSESGLKAMRTVVTTRTYHRTSRSAAWSTCSRAGRPSAAVGAPFATTHEGGGRRTNRTETMYGLGGTAYVYFVYGMYYQFNVVTNVEETPHAVLVRALEPVEGLPIMRRRRAGRSEYELTSGPGRLCVALGIDRGLDKDDLLGDRVWIEEADSISPGQIARGPRIGIDYAEKWVTKPWRFWLKDNPFVSRHPRLVRNRR